MNQKARSFRVVAEVSLSETLSEQTESDNVSYIKTQILILPFKNDRVLSDLSAAQRLDVVAGVWSEIDHFDNTSHLFLCAQADRGRVESGRSARAFSDTRRLPVIDGVQQVLQALPSCAQQPHGSFKSPNSAI